MSKINDLEFTICMQILRQNVRGLDEEIAKGMSPELQKRLHRIEISAQLAQTILDSLK